MAAKSEEGVSRVIQLIDAARTKNSDLVKAGGFADFTDVFSAYRIRLQRLQPIDDDGQLPVFERNKLNEALSQLIKTLTYLATFQASGQQPFQFGQYVEQFKERADRFIQMAQPWAVEFALAKLDSEELNEKRAKIDQLSALIQQSSDEQLKGLSAVISDLKKQAQENVGQAIAELKNAAAYSGVAEAAEHFIEERKTLEDQAKAWLAGVWMGLVSAAVLPGGWLLAYSLWDKLHTNLDLLHAFGVAAALLSLGSFIVLFCARNYRASKHNLTVITHRINSLNTFHKFAFAAKGDTAVRAAVIQKAAESVFGHQETGYYSQKGRDSPSAVVEVVNRITDPES